MSLSSRIPRRTVQPFTSVLVDPAISPLPADVTPKSSRTHSHSRKNSDGSFTFDDVKEGSHKPKDSSRLLPADVNHLPPSVREQYFQNLQMRASMAEKDKDGALEVQRRLEDSIFICGMQTAGKYILMKQLKKTWGKKKEKGKGNEKGKEKEKEKDKDIDDGDDLPDKEDGPLSATTDVNGEDPLTAKERDQLRHQRTIAFKFKLTNRFIDCSHLPLNVLHLISEYSYDDASYATDKSATLLSSPTASQSDLNYGGLSFHFFYFPTAGKVSKYFQSLSGIMGLIFVVNLSDYDRITVKSSGGDDNDDNDLVFENSLAASMSLFEEYCKVPLNYFDLNYRFILLLFINKTEFHNKITHGDQGFPITYFPDFPVSSMLKREKERERERERRQNQTAGNNNSGNTPTHSSSSSTDISSIAAQTSSSTTASSSVSATAPSSSNGPSDSTSPSVPTPSSPPQSTVEYCHDEQFAFNYIRNAFINRHSKCCKFAAQGNPKSRRMKSQTMRERRNTHTEEEKGEDQLGALFHPPTNPSVAGVGGVNATPTQPNQSGGPSKELSQLYVLDIDVLEDSAMMQIFSTLKDFTMLKFLHKSRMDIISSSGKGKDERRGENGDRDYDSRREEGGGGGIAIDENRSRTSQKDVSFFACCSCSATSD